MKTEDKLAFFELLTIVGDTYGRQLSEGVLMLYWQTLAGYELAEIRQAVGFHMQNPDSGQFFPKPADIIRMIEGSTQSAAAIAWSKVDSAIQRVGTYRDVVFDDPLIHRVILDMGGWIQMGTKTLDEWPFVGNDFQARYRAYRQRRVVPEYPPRLIGQTNGHNASHGFALEPPAYVGNHERCALVETRGSNTDNTKSTGAVVISLVSQIKNSGEKNVS